MKFNKACDYFNVIDEAVTDASSRNLMKIYYNINIVTKDEKGKEFKAIGNGTIRVPSDVSPNILCVEDIINFIVENEVSVKTNNTHDGITDKELLAQMLFAFMDVNNAQYLTTKDSINFSFDYGPSENNNVGLMVAKNIGSPMFSIVMRMNGQALPNQFNKEALDNRILSFSSMGKTK